MKILHVIFAFPHDGAETMLVDIMNDQCKTEKVELIVINNVYNSDLLETIDKSVRVHLLNRPPKSINPIKLFQFNFKIFKIRPDIIHFHDHNGILCAKYKAKARTFLTIHGLENPSDNLSKYDKLIAISEAVKNNIILKGFSDPIVISNGVDFDQIKRCSSNKPIDVFKMVDIGRLSHEIKGQDILLKALHILIYNHGVEGVKLDFVGEGPSMKYLENLSNKLNLDNYVRFIGLKSRHFIYNKLHTYDLLIQPSINEGFGLTVVEAMAAKIPVLVSNIDGPLEIIKNGQYGEYFESGNPTSCANALLKVIKGSRNTNHSELLDKTYDYALANYSIQKTVQLYLNSYKSVNNPNN